MWRPPDISASTALTSAYSAAPIISVPLTPSTIGSRCQKPMPRDQQRQPGHDHVDQAQDQQHDFHFAKTAGVRHQVPKLFQEEHDVHALRDDQAQEQGQLQPAGTEDQAGQQA
ncbi:hypothetical protein G6F46_015244 [Rhizopus delemar]|nr:hypothetical protein G6F46_015244 [Rhizopus delemar]